MKRRNFLKLLGAAVGVGALFRRAPVEAAEAAAPADDSVVFDPSIGVSMRYNRSLTWNQQADESQDYNPLPGDHEIVYHRDILRMAIPKNE